MRAVVIAALCALPAIARAESAPLRIAPASDASLSSMLLLAAAPTAPVILFDSQDQDVVTRARGEYPGPVECYARTTTSAPVRALEEDLAGVPCTNADDLLALGQKWWPSPPAVVVAPGGRYPWLVQGAALAGALGGALLPVNPHHPLNAEAMKAWAGAQWFVIGSPPPDVPIPPGARVQRLDNIDAVRAVALGALGDFSTVVVANPADRRGRFSPSSLSLLAPRIAAVHRAPLILVSNSAADVVESEVSAAISAAKRAPTHLYLVGDELALRSHKVPDPVLEAGGPEALGGARDVRVELFSRLENGEPQDYAVGRFVAEDVARGSATLSRQLAPARGGKSIVFLSNADEVFALGETISRSTVSELRNAGLKVRASYRDAITPAVIQDALLHAGLLVWEGHARDLTLEERGGISVDRAPPFVVLQGCYTLDRSDPFILFDRGTEAIVATSAAIYSASGSAFARALFDSLLYGGTDLGTAVRDARNFLLAVTDLKKQRGHSDWTKTYRAALAFALWGDPTMRPPLATSASTVPPATWQANARDLTLTIPSKHLEANTVGPYTAQPVPRAMLSGLILREGDKPARTVKELFFTAIPAPAGKTRACPPAKDWEVQSLYAPLTRTLSVLARPPGDSPSHSTTSGTFTLPLVADRCP